MLCFLSLQPAVDYRGLAVMGRKRVTQARYFLFGLCYSGGCLYVVEAHQKSLPLTLRLAVFRVHSDSEDITRLDTLRGLGKGVWCAPPVVDHHSRRVFVPCDRNGVTVAHLDGDRLVRERTLTCVRDAGSVDVMSRDTVYIGGTNSVHVVDAINDRITLTLEKPNSVRDKLPCSLAVLGDSVMVCYAAQPPLVVYRHGSPTPVRVIPRPVEMKWVTFVSTDCHSNFILTDHHTKTIFVLNVSGELCHTVKTGTDSLMGCTVVKRQLWLGGRGGDIVIMS